MGKVLGLFMETGKLHGEVWGNQVISVTNSNPNTNLWDTCRILAGTYVTELRPARG